MDVKYTKIPNDILEAILGGCPLSKREIQVLLLVGRNTYGWDREYWGATLAMIGKGTAIKENHLSGVVTGLLERAILLKGEGDTPKRGGWGLRCLKINKNIGIWRATLPKREPPKKGVSTLPKREPSPSIKETTTKERTTTPQKGATKKNRTSTPDEFPVTTKLKDWAYEKFNIQSIQSLQDQTEAFLDHHKAKGSKHLDWEAAWRKWIRNWQTDFGKRTPQPGTQNNQEDYYQSEEHRNTNHRS